MRRLLRHQGRGRHAGLSVDLEHVKNLAVIAQVGPRHTAATERPMSDKLVTRSGESVEINSVIEALEAAPDKAEILEAHKGLRAD